LQFGIRANLAQVLQQLLQVLLVGMTIGMMRNVVPALADTEFGVPRGSFMLLVAFVVAFGFVKGAMNFVAGRLAERPLVVRRPGNRCCPGAGVVRRCRNPVLGRAGDQTLDIARRIGPGGQVLATVDTADGWAGPTELLLPAARK